jgi:oxygen-independent coproporphyrinogen-3 oxidase
MSPTRSPDIIELLEHDPKLRVDRDDYNYNVTYTAGSNLDPESAEASLENFDREQEAIHLYFHVPLCSYICHYCNFVKRLIPKGNETNALTQWTDLLIEESTRYLQRCEWLLNARVESVYFGGGTAALLLNVPEAAHRLFAHVHDNYRLSEDCEITMEGNPDNFGEANVRLAMELGANRFSMGVQSLQDEVNDFAGRGHSSALSVEAIGTLGNTGHPYNVDMIYGQPRQSAASFSADVERLIELGVPTITMYRLRNNDRQALAIGNRAVWNNETVRRRLVEEGAFPSLEDTYRMRMAGVDVLLEHGYWPSPACWWSAPGTYDEGLPHLSKSKWERYDSMIAFGPGAYGWINSGDEHGIVQIHNTGNIGQYANHMSSEDSLPISFGRRITGVRAVAATLAFNFKANRPIPLRRYSERFGVDLLTDEPFAGAVATMLRRGYLERSGDGTELLPTLLGEALHEEIISCYLHTLE